MEDLAVLFGSSNEGCSDRDGICQTGGEDSLGTQMPNDEGRLDELLHQAIMSCDPDRLQRLIEMGADIDLAGCQGMTRLHFAALTDLDQTRMLLQHGAGPNACNHHGETPLHAAVLANRADIVGVLLANGADVSVQRDDGQTPLHEAVVGDSSEIVELLLRAQADPEVRNNDGDPVLIVAANMYGVWKNNAVDLLLEHGADVNAAGDCGFRAIHCAAAHGYDDLVRRLADAGADLNSVSEGGRTALDVAASEGHVSTVELLRELGGRPSAGAGGVTH